jgi:hypothetical protein
MARLNSETTETRMACPQYGHTVTVRAVWHESVGRRPTLSDFACNCTGMCGIPAWDPCPLYVRLRESGGPPPVV